MRTTYVNLGMAALCFYGASLVDAHEPCKVKDSCKCKCEKTQAVELAKKEMDCRVHFGKKRFSASYIMKVCKTPKIKVGAKCE